MHKVHKSASGRKQRAARHDNNQSMTAQKKNFTMDLGFFLMVFSLLRFNLKEL